MTIPVKAQRVATKEEFFNSEWSSAFFIPEDGKFILTMCPCGCGSSMRLSLYREGDSKPATNAWKWDGNFDNPTLEPSIRDLGGCRFHGHLRNGVWTFEGDSGVKS